MIWERMERAEGRRRFWRARAGGGETGEEGQAEGEASARARVWEVLGVSVGMETVERLRLGQEME